MAISNYQTPGVYVTQAQQVQLPTPNNSLNIAFFGYVASGSYPTTSQSDRFLVTTSGNQTFTLTASGQITGFVLTYNTTGTTILQSGVVNLVSSGFNASNLTTSGGVTQFTASGITPNTWLSATYSFPTAQFGTLYTFSNYNAVLQTFGAPFSYSGSNVVVSSPNSLAAYLAFQNGASQVSCMNILAPSGGTTQDFMNAIYSTQNIQGIDVIVPLKYDNTYNTPGATGGVLFNGLSSYLTAQANNGVYMRGFIGLDGSVASGTNQSLISTCSAIANNLNSTRVSLTAPQTVTYNPGQNGTPGSSTGTINIDGIYFAAATAGLFTGQPSVATPITNKYVNGFVSIPNQITTSDSNTLQSYGVVVLRQDRNSNILVRQGLTTNTTNWITQEISINAIGDQLTKNISNAYQASGLIGSPLTSNTFSSVTSTLTDVLTQALGSGLILSYRSLSAVQSTTNPTTINISFQYSAVVPLNYINVVLSLDSNTGLLA